MIIKISAYLAPIQPLFYAFQAKTIKHLSIICKIITADTPILGALGNR